METRSKFTASQKKDAVSLAQGLFESKVLVERPPTVAQRMVYNTAESCGVPRFVHSRKSTKKEKIGRTENIVQQPSHAWKPFSGEKSLSKDNKKFASTRDKKINSVLKTMSHLSNEDVEAEEKESRLPKSVEAFEPWICEENLEEWVGLDSDPNCFVILPCGFDDIIDYLPPLQMPDEPLLKRPEKEVKKYIPPKILHNYNYLENQSSFQCQHDRKLTVEVRKSEPRLRTCEIIRQEIEDLERLLQGYSNPNSSSIVNRYQHEIRTLRDMVIETLRDYNLNRNDVEGEPEVPVIQGDLFEFLERHDEVIITIKEKRDACVKELARLEDELRGNT